MPMRSSRPDDDNDDDDDDDDDENKNYKFAFSNRQHRYTHLFLRDSLVRCVTTKQQNKLRDTKSARKFSTTRENVACRDKHVCDGCAETSATLSCRVTDENASQSPLYRMSSNVRSVMQSNLFKTTTKSWPISA